jgi:glycosyltransferase involved in cell wall biosynthesis
MKIALVAPAEELIPPIKYGGTELVVANLAKGLVARGHVVHVYGAAGSSVSGVFHPTFDMPVRAFLEERGELGNPMLRMGTSFVSIARAIESLHQERFDIIHNHMNWRLVALAGIFSAPMITTWHTAMGEQFMKVVNEFYQGSPCISISNNQRKAYPDLHYVNTVYNGIDTDAFPFVPVAGEYLAFLGRISPDKGAKEAILAAKRSGHRLIMAAKLDASDMAYYENEVKPLIDGEQIRFIGEVDHAGKVELLSKAKATLGLIQWEEPFGLFIVESLACGTPVIAVGRGAVPEILENGKSGFIVENSIDAAAEAVASLGAIDRHYCRSVAVERFSIDHMTEKYIESYERILRNAA